MTDHTAGPLSFMAHMRRGLARLRDAQGQVSAQVTLASSAQTAPLNRQITLAGPEHVTGLSSSQIKRLVPAPGSTDFAPNFFAAVEFSLQDLPWMFTPETPKPGPEGDPRLPPWLVLAVIEERAGVRFTEPGADSNGRLQIGAPAQVSQQLPRLDDSWAWAHVQCTADLTQQTAQEALDATPDLFRSRLICPRRLVPQTDYIACLLPAYRGGVEMGLGRVVGDTPHAPAWTGAETEVMLPVYYAWRFRTAQKGDFEDLVRRLTPVDLAAGQVALDLSEPGDPRLPQGEADVGLRFKGALIGQAHENMRWDPDHAKAYQTGMAEILATHRPSKSSKNRAYDAMRDDPVVAPPLWGARKIAATSAPKPAEEGAPRGWFSELNYTPSHRAAAGLGAEAVRRNQEVLMAEAWSQLAELREINRRLNQTRLAAETGKRLKATKIDALPVAEASALASPFKTRLGAPFQKMIRAQDLEAAPEGLTSAALNRIARRKGPLGRKTALRTPLPSASLTWFSAQRAEAQSFAEFSVPAGLSDTNFIAQLGPIGLTDEEEAVVDFELGRDVTMRPVPLNGAVLGAARNAPPKTRKVKSARSAPQVTQVQKQQSLRANRAAIAPVFNPAPMLQARLKATLDLPETAYQDQTVPPQQLVEPIFDLSGYTMLRDISPDAVMPGVSAVPMNSVGLCEVNAEFVESWLVGANAEMAREFLWREYPGRLDGTYFRRFWDTPEGTADIAPISTWNRALGKHQIGPGKDGLLVLLLKAEVLARFPELRIYASLAQWNARGRREEARHKGRPSKTLPPRFGGWLDKRTAFFAFELKVDAARGERKPMGRNPGWFFVFEQPREGVQFGMDVPRAEDTAAPEVWADLSWSHALDAPDGLGMETHASITRGVGAQSLRFDAGLFHETWGRSASAQARITLQRPARVLMHASAMLS